MTAAWRFCYGRVTGQDRPFVPGRVVNWVAWGRSNGMVAAFVIPKHRFLLSLIMKKASLFALLACVGLVMQTAALAADAAAKSDPKAQLQELVGKVRTKLGQVKSPQEKPTEALLADELKQFDALLAEHKGDKSEPVARILFMKAMLYKEVLSDETKVGDLLAALQKDFPETPAAKDASMMLSAMKKQAEMAVGKTFPDFHEKDLEGQPLSIGNYKGKVLLVDFWATWCGPCVGELPNVLAAYKKHHDEGFEVVGISLDKDREKLTSFMKEKGMTWKQYFDGQQWQTKLAQDYGINSIPATYLLDRKGKVIARDLRGDALEEAVAKALAQKD